MDLAAQLASERTLRIEAQRQTRLRDEFIAFVAHELRSPLMAVVGWTQLLANNLDDQTYARAIAAILRAADTQERIISDLFDASAIAYGKFTILREQFVLQNVVCEALETVAPTAREKTISLTKNICAENFLVRGDAIRFKQAICNLLTNAVKFTPPKGEITLWCKRSDETQAQIAISDTGCGIEAEFMPFIFERMRRKDGALPGLGLGLSIAQYIVEGHGGTISAESWGAGQGATFTVRLPLAETAAKR